MKGIFKIIWIGVIISVILLLIEKTYILLSGGGLSLDASLLRSFSYNLLYAIPLCFVNAQLFDYINSDKAIERFKENRIFLVFIGFIGSVIVTLFTIFIVRIFIAMALEGKSYSLFLEEEKPEVYFVTLLITLFISLFFHAVYYYKELQKNKIKEQKVIAGTASAKFDALKNQLDPHFLFNSLNVLSSLIDENTKSAQKFTTALSKVYRYVLEQKNKELVTVDEELEFARTYMSLLKMRFEDSIVFNIPECSTNPESKVVPLSLQLLLENAVKHNTVTAKNPLKIDIYELDGNLVVENNLQPKQIIKKSSGVGLDNIRERYKLLTDRKVIINQEANSFAVAIPMLSKQISIMRTREENFDDRYVRARKQVEELKEFYYSLIAYVIVIPFLIFINYTTWWHFQWFWFPLIGWGIGLAFHAYKVYVNDGILGRDWERKKIQQYMREEENRTRWN